MLLYHFLYQESLVCVSYGLKVTVQRFQAFKVFVDQHGAGGGRNSLQDIAEMQLEQSV